MKNAGQDLGYSVPIGGQAKLDSNGRRNRMWVSIASLMVGSFLGFFIACILASSKRLSELDPGLNELAIGERFDHI